MCVSILKTSALISVSSLLLGALEVTAFTFPAQQNSRGDISQIPEDAAFTNLQTPTEKKRIYLFCCGQREPRKKTLGHPTSEL